MSVAAAPWRRALKQEGFGEEVPDRGSGASSGDGGRAPNTYIISYEQLTVSDPRPPTADLTLTAPPWVSVAPLDALAEGPRGSLTGQLS